MTSPAASAGRSPGRRPVRLLRRLVRVSRTGGALRLTPEERAFLPAALEVVETPVSPTFRLSALTICALLSCALAWSSLARIDEVAVAPGKVVPLGQVKVVQPLETAIIRSIHVDDGDHVRAGDPLVDLDPTEANADLTSLLYERDQAALDAEAALLLIGGDPQAPFRAPSGVAPEREAAAHRQAVQDLEGHLAEIAGIDADIADKAGALAADQAQIERDTALMPLLQERYDVAQGLYDKRIGPKPPVIDAEQGLLERRADLASAEATAGQIAAQTRSLEAKRQQTASAFLADALDRRAKAQSKLAQLDGEIAKARQKTLDRKLVSPVDGTVQTVKIHTPGAVVTSADVLMTIVPDGTGVEVEAGVENKDIGFVREGQAVAVKVDAFPFTRYGLLQGTLRKVGRDAEDAARPEPAGAGAGTGRDRSAGAAPPPDAPTYPAKVTLAQDWIMVDGHRERIQPGMRVEAEIRTGDRRVIEYLLSPVVRAVKEAGRER